MNPTTLLPPVLWHGGRALVERPTLAQRTAGDNAPNSGLGLFCATRPHDYIAGFGAHIYRLTLAEGLRVLPWTIRDLFECGPASPANGSTVERAWFEAEGRRLAEHYDVVLLHEMNGFASQAIVLHDRAIVAAERLSAEAFAAVAYDVGEDMGWARAARPRL